MYSEELQEFANRCIITHNNGRERSSRAPSFIVVGENIYSGVGLPVNYTDIVTQHWGFSEAAYYDYESNSYQPGGICGHYTQVML